jgi:hypothetical protein
MRLLTGCSLCVGISLFALGCQRREDTRPQPHNQSSASSSDRAADDSNLAARFDAASSMNNVALKDEALVKLAENASNSGNGDIAKKSIDGIQNVALHDEAAYNSALLLAKSGTTKVAVAIAQSINNVAKRDEALAKIAKGDSSN